MKTLVILTWPSWSGKTTLQQELLNRWWSRPLNFTTRKPRTKERIENLSSSPPWEDFLSEELDEYIFLTEWQYMKKLINWDFLEHTNWYGNWYWMSKFLPEWDVIAILDPVGRAQVMEKAARIWWKIILWNQHHQLF